MLSAITTLLLFQLAGEVLAQLLALPVPGPVIGMALLFAGLMMRGGASEPLRTTANHILSHFSILFIPGGVGVMLYLPRLAEEWLPIGVSLIASTVLTLAVTAVALRLLRGQAKPEGEA